MAVKKSKHMINRYFLITDKVHQEDLEIRYNPTGDMLAGYQSNTHQVKLFRTMSYQLIESLTDYDDEKENRKMHPLLMPSIDAGTNVVLDRA